MTELNVANFYDAIINAGRDPLLVIDLKMNCVHMNMVARKTLDLDENSYRHRPLYELVNDLETASHAAGEQCPVQEVFQSGKLVRVIREMRFHSTLKRTYEISVDPLRDGEGQLVGAVVVLRDVTASQDHMNLQELTAKIEKAKREWEDTMDCIDDFVILVDSNNKIKRFNKPLADFMALPFADIIGHDLADLLNRQGLDWTLSSLEEKACEYQHRSSGRTFVAQSFLRPSSNYKERVITFHDITYRKDAALLLEEKNEEIQKAFNELKTTQAHLLQQEKMASVGQLAAGVAHEINNPIGFVTSNINSLTKYQEKIAEFLKLQDKFIEAYCPSEGKIQALADRRKKMKIDFIMADASDLISESLDGVERVKKIVMNLKNFSRVDQAERTTVNINDCLEDTIVIAWNELKYKCTLHKEFGDIPPLSCYPQQLNQVFMNMLVNGAQAMTEPGTITIKTWFAEGCIFIAFSDTGCGIAADKLSHVFEPFYTTKEVGKGTGLGLSISYDIIVKQHNGEISISSEVDKGTTFTICLPLPNQDDTP